MFRIASELEESWQSQNEPKAQESDIARLHSIVGERPAAPYVEFIARFGCVELGRDPEERCWFDYRVSFPDRTEVRTEKISHLRDLDKIPKAYDILTDEEPDDGEDFPKFPKNFLPVGTNSAQGEILLETGEHAGRVWYWPFSEWAWGLEGNIALGFVADDFYQFVNSLRPD